MSWKRHLPDVPQRVEDMKQLEKMPRLLLTRSFDYGSMGVKGQCTRAARVGLLLQMA